MAGFNLITEDWAERVNTAKHWSFVEIGT
jgi:hypothetical protein